MSNKYNGDGANKQSSTDKYTPLVGNPGQKNPPRPQTGSPKPGTHKDK